MYDKVHQTIAEQNIFIGCAAVADYRAKTIAENKIKKQGDEVMITLVKNPDIVASVGNLKQNRPMLLGLQQKPKMWKNMHAKNGNKNN